jgi:hypothetical protein
MVPAAGAVRQPIPSRAVAGHEEAAHRGRLRDGLHRLKSDRNPRCQRESGRVSRASSPFTDAPSSIGPCGELADRPGIGGSGEPAPHISLERR